MNEPVQARFGHFLVRHILPQRENKCLDSFFSSTFKQIVQGRAYKEIALNGTGFTYFFKSWAKNQQQFQGFSKKEMNSFCQKVNKASLVFEKWQTISGNLADPRITEIDARRFSVSQFYDARSMDWCLSYNEILRQKGKKPNNLDYTDEKFNAIVDYIRQSGILGDIRYEQDAAARLGERLKMTMIAECRRMKHAEDPIHTED